MEGVPEEAAREALRLAAHKLSVKTQFVTPCGGPADEAQRDSGDWAPEELADKQAELQEQLFRLRVQQSIGQLDNTLKLRETRRDIARVKTVLKEKQVSR